MKPDDDGTSAFSRVTGEQPLVPHVVPPNFNLTQLSIELHRLPFNYNPPRRKQAASFIPEKLRSSSHVWLRIDRVRRPLEAPYQGPYEVLRREDDTFSLLIRGKPTNVSIDRLKPAILPADNSTDAAPASTDAAPASTDAAPASTDAALASTDAAPAATHVAASPTDDVPSNDDLMSSENARKRSTQVPRAQSADEQPGQPPQTRSGRRVKFKENADFHYFT